jgi:hypothetical protein
MPINNQLYEGWKTIAIQWIVNLLGVHRISNQAGIPARFNEFSSIRLPAGFGENPAGFKFLFSP